MFYFKSPTVSSTGVTGARLIRFVYATNSPIANVVTKISMALVYSSR